MWWVVRHVNLSFWGLGGLSLACRQVFGMCAGFKIGCQGLGDLSIIILPGPNSFPIWFPNPFTRFGRIMRFTSGAIGWKAGICGWSSQCVHCYFWQRSSIYWATQLHFFHFSSYRCVHFISFGNNSNTKKLGLNCARKIRNGTTPRLTSIK